MIGLMGGTFNPIHYGHLLMCENIREEFRLHKIVFIPAKKPPHKDCTQIIGAHHRLAMVELAISGNPYFESSDIELKREGASYTVDTLAAFHKTFGQKHDLALIIGADSLVQMETWRNYSEIFSLATIIVASRPDTDEEMLQAKMLEFNNRFNANIHRSKSVAMDYSSTEIRARIENGLSIRYRVPPEVEAYIYREKLYIQSETGGEHGY